MGFLYIAGTIFFTVYGQLVIKWRVDGVGELPAATSDKLAFYIRLLLDPFVISGMAAAFIAMLFWMAALTKYDISFAYPFMSLSFVLVFGASIVLFHEPLNLTKIIGFCIIILGIIILSRSL